jgi:hypothetical protein
MSTTSLRSPSQLATVNFRAVMAGAARLLASDRSPQQQRAHDARQLFQLAQRYETSSPSFADDLRAAANGHLGYND